MTTKNRILMVICLILIVCNIGVSLDLLDSRITYHIQSEKLIRVEEEYRYHILNTSELSRFEVEESVFVEKVEEYYSTRLESEITVIDAELIKPILKGTDDLNIKLNYALKGDFIRDGEIQLSGLIDQYIITNSTELRVIIPSGYIADAIPFPDRIEDEILYWDRPRYIWSPRLVLRKQQQPCSDSSLIEMIITDIHRLQRKAQYQENETLDQLLEDKLAQVRRTTCIDSSEFEMMNRSISSIINDLDRDALYCGNGICDENESSETCAGDCEREQEPEPSPSLTEPEEGIIDSLASQSDYDFFTNVVFLAAICFLLVNGTEYIRSIIAPQKGDEKRTLDADSIESEQRADDEGRYMNKNTKKSDDDPMDSL